MGGIPRQIVPRSLDTVAPGWSKECAHVVTCVELLLYRRLGGFSGV
jgi:hypothetical protein